MDVAFSSVDPSVSTDHLSRNQNDLSHNNQNSLSQVSSLRSEALDSDFSRITSRLEKKYKLSTSAMETSTESKHDKFQVSFNSDTSDSDDEAPIPQIKSTQPNGIVEKITKTKAAEEADQKPKKKKKDKEKNDSEKPSKISKKSDKNLDSVGNDIETQSEKKSKSDKKEKKNKKSKSEKETSELKCDKKEKKEKESKEKASKKASDASNISYSDNDHHSRAAKNNHLLSNGLSVESQVNGSQGLCASSHGASDPKASFSNSEESTSNVSISTTLHIAESEPNNCVSTTLRTVEQESTQSEINVSISTTLHAVESEQNDSQKNELTSTALFAVKSESNDYVSTTLPTVDLKQNGPVSTASFTVESARNESVSSTLPTAESKRNESVSTTLATVDEQLSNIVSTFSNQDQACEESEEQSKTQNIESLSVCETDVNSGLEFSEENEQNRERDITQSLTTASDVYSSQNIQSIYFSGEFHKQTKTGLMDGKWQESDVKTNDGSCEAESKEKVVSATAEETPGENSGESHARASTDDQSASTSNWTQCASNVTQSADRRSVTSVTQDSYAAAMQRAFAGTTSRSRDSTENRSRDSAENMSRDNVPNVLRPDDTSDSGKFEYDGREGGREGGRNSMVGREALERTTTFLAGDRQSTDELIKRILAESRGEAWPARSERDVTRSDRDLCDFNADNNVDNDVTGLDRMDNVGMFEHDHDMRLRTRPPALGAEFNSREMQISDNINAEPRRGMYVREDYDALNKSQMQSRSVKSPSGGYDMEGEGPAEGQGAGSHRNKYRSGLMRKQAAIYDDYAQSFTSAANRYAHDMGDDSDDDRYTSRRRQRDDDVIYIPDEDFIPTKAEDTDEVVQERTAEIRGVVDNQSAVLTRLKSASDSFDELQDELKAIKQQFIESSMRRSVILDDIEYEREQWSHDMQQAATGYAPPHAGYASPARHYGALRRYGRAPPIDDDDEVDMTWQYGAGASYSSTQSTGALRQSAAALDKDLESDTITSGALHNLAIATRRDVMKTDDDVGKSYTTYAPSARRGRSASMFDNVDLTYDITASVRPKSTSRFTSNGLTDDDDAESYTSPNLPSYRRYDNYVSDRENHSYGARDYTTSYSGRYSTDASRYDDAGSSISSDSGRYGHRHTLLRSQTVDSYNYHSAARDKYSTPQSSFSSRFLDKVREKRATAGEIKPRGDKPFTSRFLGGKTTFDSPYSSRTTSKPSASESQEQGATAGTAES